MIWSASFAGGRSRFSTKPVREGEPVGVSHRACAIENMISPEPDGPGSPVGWMSGGLSC